GQTSPAGPVPRGALPGRFQGTPAGLAPQTGRVASQRVRDATPSHRDLEQRWRYRTDAAPAAPPSPLRPRRIVGSAPGLRVAPVVIATSPPPLAKSRVQASAPRLSSTNRAVSSRVSSSCVPHDT